MKLVVLANREPLRRGPKGYEVALGGLAAALYPLLSRLGGVWVAWGPGGEDEDVSLSGVRVLRVPLSPALVAGYYRGYANQGLWPLFHLFLEKFRHKGAWWRRYREVNRRFAARAFAAGGEEALYWVHDYHLALAPAELRALGARRVGVFWHIPWPPLEAFSVLPEAKELLAGLLGADLVGFHTEEYAERFREAAKALLGAEVAGDEVVHAGRRVRVGAFPIGVDVSGLLLARKRIENRAEEIRRTLGRRLIVGADRLDYTKGVVERIKAYRLFLEKNPWAREKVLFIQLAAPSREDLPEYRRYRARVERLAKSLSRRFPGAFELRYQALARDELLAHFAASELALVTPLRDGMNLVALEYALVSEGLPLVSRFAGVARYLKGAPLVNPYDVEGLSEEIARALALSPEKRRSLWREVFDHAKKLDVGRWAEGFLGALS